MKPLPTPALTDQPLARLHAAEEAARRTCRLLGRGDHPDLQLLPVSALAQVAIDAAFARDIAMETLATVRAAVIEECAKAAEQLLYAPEWYRLKEDPLDGWDYEGDRKRNHIWRAGRIDAAHAIRALAKKPEACAATRPQAVPQRRES